jgi:hypothetical protein
LGPAIRQPEASLRWSHPRLLGVLLVAGLVIAALSLYVAGDWRNGDVSLYHAYALGFWGGLPHPLLPVEYPPLSVFPFGLSLVGPATWYPDVFAFWMGTIFVLGYLAFRRYATPRRAGAYVVYALAAGAATLLFRYDLVPALVAVTALWLLQRNRFAAVYPLLAVGTLLKLFPLVLLPVAAVAHWRAGGDETGRRRWDIAVGVGACLAIVAAGFVAAAIVPTRGGGALIYNFGRPPEVESVPATLIWLGSLIGIPATVTTSYGSFGLTGSLSPFIGALADVGLVAGLLWVYWRQLRGRLTTGQAAVAAVLVLLCTSKVLSAQYLLWVVPLLATTVGFQMRWLFVCLLTALIFPTLFEVGAVQHGASVTYSAVLLIGIAGRNALLLFLTARFLLAPGVELPPLRDQPATPYALATNR